jgi:hypothetical protein
MRLSQSYTLLSAVLATTLVSARPAPRSGGITSCSPDGKAFITAAGNVPCAAGLVCKPELVTQGVNPCTWPSEGGTVPSVTTSGQQPVNSLVPSAPTVLESPGPARPAPEGKRLVVYWSVYVTTKTIQSDMQVRQRNDRTDGRANEGRYTSHLWYVFCRHY